MEKIIFLSLITIQEYYYTIGDAQYRVRFTDYFNKPTNYHWQIDEVKPVSQYIDSGNTTDYPSNYHAEKRLKDNNYLNNKYQWNRQKAGPESN